MKKHCVLEPNKPKCSGTFIQTDTRSFFVWCDACGAGGTFSTRSEAKKWTKAHNEQDTKA